MTQNLKSNTKLTHDAFGTFICPVHHKSLDYLRKCNYYFYFYFFENKIFTLSSSSSSSIYNIFIAINTPTTMKNQFEALNAPKNDFDSFYLISYELNTTYFSLSLYIHPKKP